MDKSVYTRPKKPHYMTVTRRLDLAGELSPLQVPELLEVDSNSECHVTPPDVAARMVDYLGPVGDYLTLEPQAGTGSLIQALYNAGYSRYELTAVERHSGLCSVIKTRFKNDQYITPINECFLDYAKEAKGKIEFPQIITNPPFRKVRQHMAAALSLLGRGGHDLATLVALVPITYEHEEAELLETLGPETFAHAKVNTKIIRIER